MWSYLPSFVFYIFWIFLTWKFVSISNSCIHFFILFRSTNSWAPFHSHYSSITAIFRYLVACGYIYTTATSLFCQRKINVCACERLRKRNGEKERENLLSEREREWRERERWFIERERANILRERVTERKWIYWETVTNLLRERKSFTG